MEFTYIIWIALCTLGVISGTYIIVKEKRKGVKASSRKRELQSSIFFTIVMFLTAAVAYVGTDITLVSLIPFTFFIMGLIMIIINLWKRRKTKAE